MEREREKKREKKERKTKKVRVDGMRGGLFFFAFLSCLWFDDDALVLARRNVLERALKVAPRVLERRRRRVLARRQVRVDQLYQAIDVLRRNLVKITISFFFGIRKEITFLGARERGGGGEV